MNNKERMLAAMSLQEPDRVPVMCQLSIGHLLLNTDISPIDLWYTAEGCALAWVEMQRRYRFDGILMNLCGPPHDALESIARVEEYDREYIIRWDPGAFDYTHTIFPLDDLPRNIWPDGEPFADFDAFDPEKDLPDFLEWLPVSQGMKYPVHPDSRLDSIHWVQSLTGGDVSLHGEVFSPWDYHLATFGVERAIMAVMDDPGKVHAILEGYCELCIRWALEQIGAGVDALTLSSPWAGGGFLSRKQYQEFILPYERKINNAIRQAGVFCCTHTCGKLGDRLDLVMESNTNGVECLDPPPLGNVELADAKRITQGKVFIKGNIDSVNVLLGKTAEEVKEDARQRIEIAKPGGGYILSTACSVAPHVPPDNLEILCEAAEEYGRY
ncbi:MAG: uroporphyrinogen decarboxylase family protein [Candidatus Omnitrophota bacterium]